MKKIIFMAMLLVLLTIIFSNIFCTDNIKPTSQNTYLNHNDTVKYIGKEQCQACHASIYKTFIETGMGKSFNLATRSKSAANFSKKHVVYDAYKKFYYMPFWIKDTMYIMEFRLEGKDTTHKRIERVDYIIGSGQHTNSHLTNINGYIYQLPLTWYAQKRKWDLPPGYEKGKNVRFTRAIEFECMSCHNAMPSAYNNSINKFINIPNGIDCERCHGPGELHMQQKLAGNLVDTAHEIDYTIVNPKKLSWERQIDLCQRCHLQGNAILKKGKTFKDFKPGMVLSNFYDVYMPKYTGNDEEFIMASHAQRLQLSKCFVSSSKEKTSKENPSIKLTCISCHNPHVSVKITGKETFNNACIKCHVSANACTEKVALKTAAKNNCVACHMPKSGTIDIPHVTVHDHWIRKPAKQKEIDDIKTFVGIYCINNKENNNISKANAYINYVEKFDGEIASLDSAKNIIQKLSINDYKDELLDLKIHLLYMQKNNNGIVSLAQFTNSNNIQNPWLCYRVGQAYQNNNDALSAKIWYLQAVKLAPQNVEFINKLASSNILLDNNKEAVLLLDDLIKKNPKIVDAYVNKGFALVKLQLYPEALSCYNMAIKLDCDNAQALLNRAGLYHLLGNNSMAKKDLKAILKINPKETYVIELLKSL